MARMYRWWEIYWRLFAASWRMTIVLVASVIVIWIVAHFYLIPASETYHTATPELRRSIRAVSLLLMAVLLTMLALGTWWAAKRRR